MISASQFADKWAQGMQGAGPAITAGVMGMTTNPAQVAATAIPKMRANFLAAVDSGRVASGLGRVTLTQIQQAMIQKGIPNIMNAVTTAKPKVAAFAAVLLPFIQNLRSTVKAMPNITQADSKAHQLAWSRGMRQLNYKDMAA